MRIIAGVDAEMHHGFDNQHTAHDHSKSRNQGHQIAGHHLAQRSCLDERPVHHQQTGDTARRKRYDGNEDQSEIELPYRGKIAQSQREQGNKNGPDDGADKEADTADEVRTARSRIAAPR